MRKTVTIDGREIKLVSNGATPIFYKQEFGSDFFADLIRLTKSMEGMAGKDMLAMTYEQIDNLDLTLFFNVVYILAKQGDKNLNDMTDWLEDFDEFPIMEIIPDIMEILQELLIRKKK